MAAAFTATDIANKTSAGAMPALQPNAVIRLSASDNDQTAGAAPV